MKSSFLYQNSSVGRPNKEVSLLQLFCVAVGERDSGVAKVTEWQHTMYGLDSGINSGATTVRDDDGDYSTSKHYTMTTTVTREEPGEETAILCQHSQALHQLILIFLISSIDYEITTRSQRVRAAMFPETLEPGTTILSTQTDLSEMTNVQRLAEPSQMLKTAIIHLINYQDDAELATRAVPELTKLLNDEDQVWKTHMHMPRRVQVLHHHSSSLNMSLLLHT